MVGMGKRKKAQLRVLEEIKNQLVLQAERWGREGHYTPLKLEEMELDASWKIKGDFLAEKANLEYELHMLDSDKKESLIKLEKLEGYLKKADRVIVRHEKRIKKMIEKLIGDKGETKKALSLIEKHPRISVLISDN